MDTPTVKQVSCDGIDLPIGTASSWGSTKELYSMFPSISWGCNAV